MFGVLLSYCSLIDSKSTYPLTQAKVPQFEVNYLVPPQSFTKWYNVYLVEMTCTFIFVLINLIVKTRKTSPTLDGFLGCLAVALTLASMIILSANHSGGCLNPAVGFAQTMWNLINQGTSDKYYYKFLWVYIFAPYTGAVMAGLAHRAHLKAYKKIVDAAVDDLNASKMDGDN